MKLEMKVYDMMLVSVISIIKIKLEINKTKKENAML